MSDTARTITCRDDASGEIFAYLVCRSCGLERLSPRPVPEAIGGYYPDTYASHVIRPASTADRVKQLIYEALYAPENRLGWKRAVLKPLLWPLRGYSLMGFRAVAPRRVFEFGAATGNDLVLFRREGWEVAGCEPSARACAIAAERGVVLQNTTAEAAVLAPCSVSCVVMNNVLEHLHDPRAALRKAWEGLVPGGSLVLVVPNHGGWPGRMLGAAWPGYDAPRHLWGFSPETLGRLLAEVGFHGVRTAQLVQGRWAWMSALVGRHAAAPAPPWRQRWAPALSLPLVVVGAAGAALGRGGFMRVVAEKP